MEFEITIAEKEDAEKIHKTLDRLFEALQIIPDSKTLEEMRTNLLTAVDIIDEVF